MENYAHDYLRKVGVFLIIYDLMDFQSIFLVGILDRIYFLYNVSNTIMIM